MDIEKSINPISLNMQAEVIFDTRDQHEVFCLEAPRLSREGWRYQRAMFPDGFPYVGPKLFAADTYPRKVRVSYKVLALTLESLGSDIQNTEMSFLSDEQKTIGREICTKLVAHFTSMAPGESS